MALKIMFAGKEIKVPGVYGPTGPYTVEAKFLATMNRLLGNKEPARYFWADKIEPINVLGKFDVQDIVMNPDGSSTISFTEK